MAKSKYTAQRTFARHKAMAELVAHSEKAYNAILDKMLKELTKYIRKEVMQGVALKKAEDDNEGMYGFVKDVDWPDDGMVAFQSGTDDSDSPFSVRRFQLEKKMSLLTPSQMEEVKRIIRDYHLAYAVGVLGPDSIPPADVQRLMDLGIVAQDLAYVYQPGPNEKPPDSVRLTDMAYQYGNNLGGPNRKKIVDLGYDAFQTHLQETEPKFTPVDRQAMGWARYNAGEHIRGFGDKVANQVSTLIRDADAEERRKYVGTVRRELEANIDHKATWRKLATEIGHATEDWTRDVQRIAATEKQYAMQEGTVRAISKGREPEDIRVAKIPSPDACKHCIRLHLTAGAGSPPRIFKMSELLANGTNVGRKAADWKPTVGPVHPWCGCSLVEIPDGWGFNEDGDMVPASELKKGEDVVRPYMTYGDSVPTHGVTVRVADPQKAKVIAHIIAEAPPEIFHKDVGITLITTDMPRPLNPLEDNDYAYWTKNEIRISQTLPIERLPRVLRHEIGHSLNVYLMKKYADSQKVRLWHKRLWDISKQEGWVSSYADKLPIENAAEVTRMYLFERSRLEEKHPKQYAFVHADYKAIFE